MRVSSTAYESRLHRKQASLLGILSFLLPFTFITGKAQQAGRVAGHAQGIIAEWNFDSVKQGFVVEVVSGRHDPIVGISQLENGPHGSAILMDGYTTAIHGLPVERIAQAQNFSISCWIHLDAYPWNELPIFDQIAPKDSLLFGIDAEGHLKASLTQKAEIRSATTTAPLPLRRWLLLTLAVSSDGEISMTVNGRNAPLKEPVAGASGQAREDRGPGLLIGHVRHPLLPGPPELIHPQLPVEYSLQGSLGSLTVYNHLLDQTELNILLRQAGSDKDLARETAAPVFPRGDAKTGEFGAFYTNLKYEPAWDHTRRLAEDSDVVVRFPSSPIRLVFWQGTSYVPAWVTENNRWYSDEFMEVYGHPRCPYGEDCEPMSDKQVRYSQVKIVENTPARVVIHWRYALSEVQHYEIADADSVTAWGDWGDEYWTVFPDGVAIRRQVLWSSSRERDKSEFQESIVLVPAGETPEESIHFNALTFVNLKGEQHTYRWLPKIGKEATYPQANDHFCEPTNAVIQWVNLKSVWKPFEVAWGSPVTFDSYTREKSLSAFEWWNHWPVAQIPSSGRPSQAPDRPGHTSLSHIYWPFYRKHDASIEKILMTGLTTKTAAELVPLALSWRQPASADVSEGAKIRYDASQRAYVISGAALSTFFVTLHGSQTTPIRNPSFLIDTEQDHASVSATVDSAKASPRIAVGRVEGLMQIRLIAFIFLTSDEDVKITFHLGH